MQRARWSTTVAAAALIALPVVAAAQSTQSPSPKELPTQQAQPPASPSPQQQPAQPSTPAQPPAAGQADASAAKTHLSAAREILSQLAAMPEAAKLQGEARTHVSQLISNFNALITTQSEWRAAYAKVDETLIALVGPESGASQPVGTSGSAAAASQVDPAIRAKLVEFRTHLKEFEKAAGGGAPAPSEPAAYPSASSQPGGAMPPSAATGATASPANPAAAAAGDQPRPTGTSGVTPASPTANMDPADRAQAASQVNASAGADAQKELDAISSILSRSKTGALTRTQTAQLKKHVETLRALLAQK